MARNTTRRRLGPSSTPSPSTPSSSPGSARVPRCCSATNGSLRRVRGGTLILKADLRWPTHAPGSSASVRSQESEVRSQNEGQGIGDKGYWVARIRCWDKQVQEL